MKDGSSDDSWDGLDVSTALRILRNAGRPDPMAIAGEFKQQLQSLIDSLCNLSVHDGLTGLVNATSFHAALARELERSNRTGRTCALLLLDIDLFKLINDNQGHPAGDFVLQSFAHRMKQSLRAMDTAARIGGDEFAVILPECTPDDAVIAATRIHNTLSPLELESDRVRLRVTASAGLVWTDMRPAVAISVFLDAADRELYRAKQSGRSCLCHPALAVLEVSKAERAALFTRRNEEEPSVP